jgi:hypothetical protein
MAKNKPSRKETYAKALSGYGYSFDEVQIVAYEFPTLARLKEFHYALIAPSRVEIIFFDNVDYSIAQCAVRKDDKDTIGRLEYFASQHGGKLIAPKL